MKNKLNIMLKKIFSTPVDATLMRQVMVFGFFLIINLISVILFNRFCAPTGAEYESIARSLIKGTGYSGAYLGGQFGPSSFMAPLYCSLIYLSFRFFGIGSYLPVQLLHALLLALVPLFLLRIRKHLFPEFPEISWGVLLLPSILPFTMYSGYVIAKTLSIILVTAGFSLFLDASEHPSWHSVIALGVLAGITGLTDPVPLLVFIIGFIWLLFHLHGRSYLRWLLGVLVALIIVSPWLYRNYHLLGAFPVLRTGFGLNLWQGNNPLATGGIDRIDNLDGSNYLSTNTLLSPSEKETLRQWYNTPMPPTVRMDRELFYFDLLSPSEKETLRQLNEWQRDQFLKRKTFASIRNWIQKDPFGYVKLKIKCLLFFWFGNAWNIDLEKRLVLQGANPKLVIFFTLALIPSFLLLILSSIGIIAALGGERTRAYAFLVLVVVILWSGTYMLTHGHTFNRYRVPLDPILFLFGLYGLSVIFRSLMESTRVSKT